MMLWTYALGIALSLFYIAWEEGLIETLLDAIRRAMKEEREKDEKNNRRY